ncbi:MAG: hypothetical protein OXG52_11535 [bacterium]|nr:hypothetical protein [bacterium]
MLTKKRSLWGALADVVIAVIWVGLGGAAVGIVIGLAALGWVRCEVADLDDSISWQHALAKRRNVEPLEPRALDGAVVESEPTANDNPARLQSWRRISKSAGREPFMAERVGFEPTKGL